jgi:hypothetical protein
MKNPEALKTQKVDSEVYAKAYAKMDNGRR